MATVIKIEHLSKQYRLGEVGTGTLSHDLNRWWHKLRGKSDPYLKVGQINDRATTNTNNYVWSLRDINLEINEGDILGIIGRNGAGKSTLLKILSGITSPTSGIIKTKGRIASLLEVGTGFHPEMTGLENIYMNGTIMGMKRSEIKSKLDEIIEFSGVAKYIDTPVKRYSSGMMVRLGFAVAAHLEPEILIVDEVLAVGDDEFQKKAIGKMQDVSKNSGRTVLFVSHNLPSLKALCTSGLLLENGSMSYSGNINDAIDKYVSRKLKSENLLASIHYFQEYIKVHDLVINNVRDTRIFCTGQEITIDLDIEFTQDIKFELDVHLNKSDLPIASFANFVFNKSKGYKKGRFNIKYRIDLPEMRSGKYSLDLYFTEPYTSWYAVSIGNIEFEILNDHHDTFLNNENLKWGGVLLSGEIEEKEL